MKSKGNVSLMVKGHKGMEPLNRVTREPIISDRDIVIEVEMENQDTMKISVDGSNGILIQWDRFRITFKDGEIKWVS